MALSLLERRLRARGLNPRNARRWRNARFLSAGIGNRATVSLGTGNSAYRVYARNPGTGGNSITFRVVVSGANTAASVSVSSNAVTFNSATNASSVATSTVNQMIGMVNPHATAGALVHLQVGSASDGTGVVAAVAATSLTGGV